MHKFAVIGAGPSGLSAIKTCLEENDEVVCFEKTDSYGGLWKYREDANFGSVTKTSVSAFSKEMTAFSDFPPPESFPNYLHHTAKMDYLKLYVEKFKLLSHIRFHLKVTGVTQCKNFDKTGQWTIKWINWKDQSVSEEIFDGVFVCTGRRNYPNEPEFPDQEIFRGKIIHSKFLKSVQDYENLKVLVVGFGNSAVDAAVDISAAAEQVYLSVRSGRWVLPKAGKKGLPVDAQYLKRNVHFFQKYCFNKTNSYLESIVNSRFDHRKYMIKPNFRILNHTPTINDDLPDKILTGRVLVKNEISRITEDGVLFKNERDVTEIDVIVVATGYKIKFPFLEDRLWTTYKKDTNLYKFVFPVGLQHNTLAIIGHVQPLGPSLPVSESQCRWAAMVFRKQLELPPQELMMEDVRIKISELSQRFPKSSKQCPIVDYLDYMDELANRYGAKPNIIGLITKDPLLYWACFFGPCLPYQYRLTGPKPWNKARDAILNFEERATFPLNPKVVKSPKNQVAEKALTQPSYMMVIILIVGFFIALFD